MKDIVKVDGHDVHKYKGVHFVYYNVVQLFHKNESEGYYLFAPIDSKLNSTATEWFWETVMNKDAFLGKTVDDVENIINSKIEKYNFDTETDKFNL